MAKIIDVPLDFTFLGEIRAEGSVRLRGGFEGNGLIKGAVYIAKGARWEGNLICDLAIVRGEFHGDLAAERVFFIRGSKSSGSVVSSKVQVQKGAYYSGAMRMRSKASNVTPLPAPATKTISRTLRQVAGH